MKKIKVVPFNKEQKHLAEATEQYFGIASTEEIDQIKIDIFHPRKSLKERKKAYDDHKKVIQALKPLFKKIVIELNRIARKRDYRNHFEFIIKEREGLPEEKFKLFLKDSDRIIEKINDNLPWPQNISNWYWSKLNIPDSLYRYRSDYKFKIPDDIYDLVLKFEPKFREIMDRIKVESISDVNPSAKYNKEDETVTIQTYLKESLYNGLTFVHELGHAIDFIKLADKGVAPLSKSRYWHEMQAYKFKFEFEKKALPEEVNNASKGEVLNDLLSTFFEYEIYTNPNQDFDEVYAEACNRCYPGRPRQSKNPFYVLENGFIFRPCGTVTSSVVQTELLVSGLRGV